MMFAYEMVEGRMVRMAPDADVAQAAWIDLWRPQPAQSERVRTLGIEVPSLEDMEEIEISNRLYRENGTDFMTVVLPGQTVEKTQVSGPVTFILTAARMVTVRHHAPRPFETFPDRADKSAAGCRSAQALFLGLAEEIIGRMADLLESTGRALDGLSREVFSGDAPQKPQLLQRALEQAGRESEALGRVRLGLLTMERAIVFFGQTADRGGAEAGLKPVVKGLMRDIQALEVHADFLSSRLSNVADMTLGMVNLSQNNTVRILSVVAALFLPPTLIASAYGMNFAHMPELSWVWGYPLALGLMLMSALFTYYLLKWKNWL